MIRTIFAKAVITTLVCISLSADAPCAAQDPAGLPGPEDTSSWYRMFAAGERYYEHNDLENAKKYFSAALRTLERDPHPIQHNDIFFSVKLSALEQRFTESYPKTYSKDVSEEDRIQSRMEQVESLRRIVNINYRLIDPRDRLVTASKERYDKALKELRRDLKAQQALIAAATPKATNAVVWTRANGSSARRIARKSSF